MQSVYHVRRAIRTNIISNCYETGCNPCTTCADNYPNDIRPVRRQADAIRVPRAQITPAVYFDLPYHWWMQSVYHVRRLACTVWMKINYIKMQSVYHVRRLIRMPTASTCPLTRCNPCTTCMRFASIAWHKKSRTYGAWLSCVAGKSAIAI